MSVKAGKPDVIPNWIQENDWSPEIRLYWITVITSFSSRDWSLYPYANSGMPDAESWAIWILAHSNNKNEAIKHWRDFCKDARQND